MAFLLLCLAVALAGCKALLGDPPTAVASPGAVPGDDPIAGGGAGGGAGAGVVKPVPPPFNFSDALREDPDPTVVDARGQSVDHFEIGPDGRTLVVYWWGGTPNCFGLKEVTVEVQHGTPIITVLEGTRAAAVGKACTMEAVLKLAVVTLDEPILADAANPGAEPGEPTLPADALPVKPVPGVRDPLPHAITGYRLSADGLTLSAYYVGGLEDCYALAAASAEPDADGLLTISLREGTAPNAVGACDDIGVAKVVELPLGEPLVLVGAFDS
jgi:hypothetical protein